ncbi:MAG: hypothetical protein F4Y00_08905 [Bacteroidetes bacterium SB0662_bin_6]|nr:hypothetical protein [Bacteroidetes bacterium SB0668_bin_1]MYE05071.1 hypothetical protein [Bacteroidetes bacterium SB0662_bin_6]
MTNVALLQEKEAEIKSAVEKILRDCLKTDVVFDDIVMKMEKFYFDDEVEEYLRIRVIFDGEQELLNLKTARGLNRNLRNGLEEFGMETFPVTTFVEKSEWEESYAVRKKHA